MYRYQVRAQIRYGHWREFQTLVEEIDRTLAAKGLTTFQLWEASFGRLDDAILVADYPSLAAYEREYQAAHSDPTYMDLWRKLADSLDGTPSNELWWTPDRPTGTG